LTSCHLLLSGKAYCSLLTPLSIWMRIYDQIEMDGLIIENSQRIKDKAGSQKKKIGSDNRTETGYLV
jgi:hypothetical protein